MDRVTNRLYNWASDFDSGTIQQALRTSRLPIIYDHVSLMSDAHFGMGATVGSVIPTRGAIIPAAVGVDIGCVDADTEFLSPNGWRRISEWAGEKVMQYHPATGLGELVTPSQYVKRDQEWFWHLHTKYGVDQMLSSDHRVLCWKPTGRNATAIQTVVTADEFVAAHSRLALGNKAKIETSFTPLVRSALPLDDEELRVQVMFMADGHLERGKIGVLRFTKARKIERARKLLDDADWVYTERLTGDGVTTFRIGPPPMPTKTYAGFWAASLDQLRVIADECLEWDGNRQDRVFYSRDLASADFIQYAFTATGHRAVLRRDARDDAEDYRVFAHSVTRIAMAGTPKTEIVRVPSPDGKAYCFSVPSGFLVLRRGGKVFMTGNCGMIAAELNVTENQLPNSLEPLLSLIAKTVPAGVGQGHAHGGKAAQRWMESHRPATDISGDLAERALKQFGSLGAGNHFFEICLDERAVVWVVLHSGSRGIGNKLAQQHISKARQLAKAAQTPLEDPDLAYFLQDTPEFNSYIADMLWAQDYALANRAAMMDAAMREVLTFVGTGGEVRRINCHHNFSAREVHQGRELWITRKGAIKADVGDMGIIPGSMGTRSYIVQGKGNEASWKSCSHGAGRRMSRTQAKKQFTAADLATQMAGKTWQSDLAGSLVDEIPSSYKDIDQVMRDQDDLVTIVHTLHQVFNYKGT